MGTVTKIARAKFAVGDLVYHRLFDYRGVVVDVDPTFESTEEWYEAVAKSRPPKDKPWYHVLVHEAMHSTYVAERNLEPDERRRARQWMMWNIRDQRVPSKKWRNLLRKPPILSRMAVFR